MQSSNASHRPSEVEYALQTEPADLRSSAARPLSQPAREVSVKKVRVRSKYVPRSQVRKASLLVCNPREGAAQHFVPESKTDSPVQRVLYSRQPVLERTAAGYRYTAPRAVQKTVRPRYSFACAKSLKEALVPWGVVHGRSFQSRRGVLQRVVQKQRQSFQRIKVFVPQSVTFAN